MKNLVLYKKGECSWTRYIRKRINNNLNFLGLASGPTGVGKSWSMMQLAYQIDSNFTAKQICFNFKQVMNLLNDEGFMKQKWKVIVFDEAQIDINARQWQSLVNRLFNYLLSTFRHRNIILLMTSPYSDFLDLSSRKLLHCEFVCKGWNKKDCTSRVRPHLLQYNSKMKKFYTHSLYVIRDGDVHKFPELTLNKPPMHIIDPYEDKKLAFTSKLNERILRELEQMEEEDNHKLNDTRKPLTKIQQRVLDLLAYKSIEDVAKELGLTTRTIYFHKTAITKKGYKIKELNENPLGKAVLK